jgi:hypothetical protein
MVMGRSSGTRAPSCNTFRSANSDKLCDGIVELPLALFIEEQHRDSDDRFSHGRDVEDGVFAKWLAAFKCLIAVWLGLYELAVAGDHHADPCITTSIDLRLHSIIETVQALGRESDRTRGSYWQRSCRRVRGVLRGNPDGILIWAIN